MRIVGWILFVAAILSAGMLWISPAPAQDYRRCASDAGCCINGVQYQQNFFPFCSATRKVDCLKPEKEFLRAAAKCKRDFRAKQAGGVVK